MSSILKVAARVMAMEHPSEEALKKYLRDHPAADPKNHTVNKDRRQDDDESGEGYEKEKETLSKSDKAKAEQIKKDLWNSVFNRHKSPLRSVLVSLAKGEKLPPRLTQKAVKELDSMVKNEKDPKLKKVFEERSRTLKSLVNPDKD